MANGNPFVIQQASPIGMIQGITQGIQGFQQNKAQAEAERADQQKRQEMSQLLQGQDTGAIAEWMAQNPKYQKEAIELGNFQDSQAKKSRLNTAYDVITGKISGREAYADRLQAIQAGGGQAPNLEQAMQTESPDFEQWALKDIAVFAPDLHRSLVGKQGSGSIRSADFDKWQAMPEGPEKDAFGRIIGAVSRSESREDYIARKQAEEDIKLGSAEQKSARSQRGKSREAREQGYIDSGVDAADSLATMNRALSLLKSVETGGFDRASIAAKRFLGIESGDEAELANSLSTAVLSQLKPIFGSAFTAAEGDRLEKISAGFGKSTKGNIRLLEQQIKIADRAARRAIRAARARGDDFAAEEIENAMANAKSALSLDEGAVEETTVTSPDGGAVQQTTMDTPQGVARETTAVSAPQVNAQGWQLMRDAAGNTAYVGPNGEIEEVR